MADKPKKRGAHKVKDIIEYLKKEKAATESTLTEDLGFTRVELKKYLNLLEKKDLVVVKKKFLGDSTISLAHPPKDDGKAGEGDADEEPDEGGGETKSQSRKKPKKKKHRKKDDGEKYELKSVLENLTRDFLGVMRLHAEVDEDVFVASLILDHGDIKACSFEHLNEAEVVFGDIGMELIKESFTGTRGDLEIFELSEEDFNSSLEENEQLKLTESMKLTDLNIKITTKVRKKDSEKEDTSFLSHIRSTIQSASSDEDIKQRLEKIRQSRIKRLTSKINLIEFSRNVEIDPVKAKRFEELRKKKAVSFEAILKDAMSKGKQERIKALRERIKSATTKIHLEQDREALDKKPVKTIEEGKKVQTKIDVLYSMLKDKGSLKLNDALAIKVGITRIKLEEWAMILEDHQLIELHYPTIGEAEIKIRQDKSIIEKDQ